MRIVHQGRGGYIEIDGEQYAIEHVADGCFAIHIRARAPSAHRAMLRELVAAEPQKWSLEGHGED
jgi:hypothetical protein